MIHEELLRDLTESYLKSLVAEVSGSLRSDFDSRAPFGELGIDSFHVLKIIKRLETDFGTLSKSLLFENFNISDLANYFVCKHEQTLRNKFKEKRHGANSPIRTNGHQLKHVDILGAADPAGVSRPELNGRKAESIRVPEKELSAHPQLQELVQGLFERYKIEGCVSLGTRKIAPNLFIGSARRGYFNYGRSTNIILVYGYAGPRDYLPVLMEEMYRYCETNNLQFNILADEKIPPISETPFSATPFGVLQRILSLKEFTLEGGAMRRLRYQVSKFEKAGICKTEEYQCGSNPETDRNIADVIDKWCEARTMVNPLVHDVKREILAGKLGPGHRLFLTYLDDVLQNVILVTAMCSEANGYLMDLEFYLPDMPMGGLEFGIVRIIETLVAEGCDVLSLGGTYGCKLHPSDNADPGIDKILDELREQNIFNDVGNLQFKNKFRPDNKPIFLCRPKGSGNPDNVTDIIMMIADPEKMQTSDEENRNFGPAHDRARVEEKPTAREPFTKSLSTPSEQVVIERNERCCILSDFGFNPLNIPHEHVDIDLKTDSWAQLQMPAIHAHMRHLHAQLQQPANVEDSLRAVFPFAHFALTSSGQAAEHMFFKAWPKKGVVLENLLFPSTIFHQIDKGFTNKELPHPAVFDLNSCEPYKGNMDWEALQAEVAQEPGAIAMVCIEVGNNAAGGYPVSIQHLKNVKALLAKHSVPLVIDGTRVVENAQLLIERDKECADKSVWSVVREIFSCADAVIGSLTKDFCVNKGGIIATNDIRLFHRLQELVREEGAGIDLIDRKMIALSLHNRKQIEGKALRRMEGVRLIWQALNEHNVPIAQPAGGHCILIDVKQVPEFTQCKYPVASFLAWLYLNTGIRAGAHSVGMQKHTRINDLVRLAIPIGLERCQIDSVINRLIHAFGNKVNIPDLVLEGTVPEPLGGIHAKYKLIKYHRMSEEVMAKTSSRPAASGGDICAADSLAGGSVPVSPNATKGFSSPDTVVTNDALKNTESSQVVVNRRRSQTQDIAVVGMAGRYPKAKNLRELWNNLVQGRDCIEDIPADRYERRLQHGTFDRYRGGFIDDVDKFDSLFFNISPREAEMLDPQERLFLEVAWESIEDAGYYPEILAQEDASRNIGVFVGAVWAMYQMLGVEEKYAGNKIVPNSFLWSIANRVSYCLNLSGPSLTIDTACSSSLTAVYLACEAIHTGECSGSIVGGVNLDLHQAKLDINQAGGALSADGLCRSFGKGANGYVAGEGVGALYLKPLEQAVQDGDNIYGVIKSAVVNHGGRTSGYTVPNPKAQTKVIVSALEKANIDARSIGYIEAHGTGTELGDPIEIAGLSSAFSAVHVENQSCAIGSIKSNIGHLEAAAGVASISKVLLQMKHRQLVPSLHSAELNEFIEFESSPFYVVQRLEDWKAKDVNGVRLPLRAGISSFGAGGSNAHIILENYEPIRKAKQDPAQPDELIFPLSAKNEEQLRESAVRLAKFLQQHPVDLNDAAYTLQIGRKSFDYRLAITAGSKAQLIEKLTCFIDGKGTENITTGHVKGGEGVTRFLNRREKEEFIRLLSQGREPHKIAGLWAEGLLADWHGFQSCASGNRVSLPTYPFADKRHWACNKSPIRHALPREAGMHPLVDTNESTFERQLFKKVFHDRDFFIYDHRVANIPTLPGVAYLELARKAGEIAARRKVQKIRNIVWVSPITVQNSTPKEVFIELKPSEATVRFEVFGNDGQGNKVLHSQGTLLYTTKQESAAEPEYIDLESIRARCAKAIDGKNAYPLFTSFGLNLGPSFQVLQEVYKNDNEILGVLKLPEFRQDDLQSMVLHPSLVDGSLQAGMSAELGEKAEEVFVPFSIGEVEILHPLQSTCFSYVTEVKENKKGKKENTRLAKSNVLIVDETGKVLVKIHESVGVPLRELNKKPGQDANADGFSRLYYLYEWEKASLPAEKAARPNPHSIVLFDTGETLRDLYQERLREEGGKSDEIILVRPGECFQDLGKQSYTINPQDKDDFTKLFERLIEKHGSPETICFAWLVGHAGLPGEALLKEAMERGVSPFLFVCQSLIKQKLDSKVQLLYLYAVRQGEMQPHNEAMQGFVNTLRLEHPKLLCKTLEVRHENVSDGKIVAALMAELQAHTQDAAAVRYEGQERYIKKLKAFDFEQSIASHPPGVGLRENGVYLITGGAGGLGLICAEFLAKEYKARLVLTGRSKLSIDREAKLEEIRKSGAEILYLPADVSNYEDVKNLISDSRSRFGEIHGIIHAAGILRDSLIRNKTLEEMSAVFAPKVYGMFHLDEATKDENLDFFVTFSSLAAVAGNAGQCDYSFANHFMDSFAAQRELLRAKGARSGKTLSINWSLWADGGMKLDEQTELYFKKTLGIKPLPSETGLDVLVKGLVSERSQFAVLEGVQEKVELAWGLRKREPVAAAPVAPMSSDQAAAGVVSADGDLFARLQNELSQIVMQFLKLDASDMSNDKILLDLGFDSIGLTTFANTINEKYQLDIAPVLFFDYPSVGEIAKYLSVERESEIRRCYGGSATTMGAPSRATQRNAHTEDKTHAETTMEIKKGWDPAALDREATLQLSAGSFSPETRFVSMPIAIVGISGVMPQSEDLEEFWENLRNSKDMTSVIPPDRWRWEDYYGDPLKEINKSNSKWGGFMKEVDKFDPLFFGISPREAQAMDPQQRIFLETVWKAIEDSGQKVSDLSGTRTGLFVGAATNDYIDVMNRLQVALDGYTASGNSHSVLANRVSFLLNLRGPSAPIDTACSSSLVALHRAIESIHTGSCDMAIVGGVQVMLSPAAYISFGMAGMLSSDGKCRAFDKGANGYVRGEGCGAIFLKPLRAAEADGNHIYAVIKATAENHGGRVTTLTAPNSNAQSALLIEAYEKARIDPSTVSYIECHGIGSSLGDPIEIQALSKAFSELYKRRNKAPAETPHCGLSSVKPNIGHLETAAGISSLLKVLLAIKHKQIPAVVHFEEVNPYVNLKGTPFYIADKLTPWETALDENGVPTPRRAGVSSFGFGGANAHVVLEEYIPSKRQSPAEEPGPQLIVLSAKNEDRLKAYLQSMHAYLAKEEAELIDLAYTLQVGRDEMPERLALVVSSTEDLKQKLGELLKSGEGLKDCYRNNIRSKEAKTHTADGAEEGAFVQALIKEKDLPRLAELWVSGTKIDWRLLYKSGIPNRISIPSYPFARERHWIPGAKRKVIEMPRDGVSKPHAAATKPIEAPVTKDILTVNSPPLAEATEQMKNDYLREIIAQNLSAALSMDAAMVRDDAPFVAYGVDSIIGVSLVRTINETLDIDLDPAKLFEHSTVDQLSQYVCSHWPEQIKAQVTQRQEMSRKPSHSTDEAAFEDSASSLRPFTEKELFAEGDGSFSVEQKRVSRTISADPIAIIGMSGRFAESDSLDAFWQNLKEGKDLVKQVSRWGATDCVTSESAGQGHCRRGSFIDAIDQFDPMFFGISSHEAICMDPQQRLFLEECWRALEDAGYGGESVHEKQCGVYVGCGSSNYDRLFPEDPPPQLFSGNSKSVIPARIAHYLNLQGPAIAVDTACSSSLVAIHLACQSLWSRETEMAVAGGVSLQATAGLYKSANRAGVLSPDGRCYSFDAKANGLVPGEGVGVLVLKRLRDALRDGDHIHGVIAGSGINQDGSSNSLIGAKARAQERLERSVYERFKINPETIQVVEADAGGAVLGDSIEYGAITRAMREYTDKKQFCAIGTVKTNIGHAGAAAGIAGVLKVLLSLKHHQIVPSLHFQKASPAIDFESSPFYVVSQLTEWPVESNQRRRAAVNSFGFSGTNAHLVIEEAPSVVRTGTELPGYVMVLSARTSEQLKQRVQDLLAFLKRTPDLSMNDLSFSLFVGRKHFNYRLSCLARNQEELIQFLDQWSATEAASQIYTSEIQEGKTREQATLKKFGNYCIQECRNSPNAAYYSEHLATIADLYIQGYSLDFHGLFPPGSTRIPLPTYPFAKERHWIDTGSTARRESTASGRETRLSAEPRNAPISGAEIRIEQVLGNLLWQESSLDEEYEKATF
jgi:acyl transferase domain-containing protein/tryptophanase/NADP-dependent 3-hydroxy acid dehydrogenase YdfG